MKPVVKNILAGALTAVVSFGLLSISCKANKGSANVAFAQGTPKAAIPIAEHLPLHKQPGSSRCCRSGRYGKDQGKDIQSL